MKLQFIRRYFGANEWKYFAKHVRVQGGLLKSLSDYPDSILVSGCQRSGTTLLTRLLSQSNQINDIWTSRDDEYDAAMILSGNCQTSESGRYCFQTTYLNDSYKEYIQNRHLPFQIIWVVRNPTPVVNSMLYNWGRYPLKELYTACGKQYLQEFSKNYTFSKKALAGISAVEMACLSYVGKQRQLLELQKYFNSDRLLVINYESILSTPIDSVAEIFNFSGLDFKDHFIKLIKQKSTELKDQRNREVIDALCMGTYDQVKKLAKF